MMTSKKRLLKSIVALLSISCLGFWLFKLFIAQTPESKQLSEYTLTPEDAALIALEKFPYGQVQLITLEENHQQYFYIVTLNDNQKQYHIEIALDDGALCAITPFEETTAPLLTLSSLYQLLESQYPAADICALTLAQENGVTFYHARLWQKDAILELILDAQKGSLLKQTEIFGEAIAPSIPFATILTRLSSQYPERLLIGLSYDDVDAHYTAGFLNDEYYQTITFDENYQIVSESLLPLETNESFRNFLRHSFVEADISRIPPE